MNHGFKLHPDGTLEITMPKGKKVGRVLVCEAGTCIGRLYYPESDDCIKHGGEWECDHVNCHPQNQNGRRESGYLIVL